MIKAIILDVDGVIVGDKFGYNFPDPHPAVIKALKEVRHKAMGNASDELKKLVVERETKSYIGESVSENGIIGILKYFLAK